MSNLGESQISERLSSLDEKFVAQGMPLKYRPNAAFKEIHGSVMDGAGREVLFDPIHKWYLEKYGDKMDWDGIIGRIPVILDGSAYLLNVPLTFNEIQVQLVEQIEGIPQKVANDFSEKYFESVGRIAAGLSTKYRFLYSLIADDCFLNPLQREMVWRAVNELETAALVLIKPGDTQISIFHAHSAAEKFLKVALQRIEQDTDTRIYRHQIPEVFKKLVAYDDRYAWLVQSVEATHKQLENMNIRYQTIGRSLHDAVSCFYSALSICGTLANLWMFDFERGSSKSTFTPQKFYRDGLGIFSLCLSVTDSGDKKLVKLDKMITLPHNVNMLAAITVEMNASGSYIEITKPKEIYDLTRQYKKLRKECKSRRTPEQCGMVNKSDPEGAYLTGLLKVKVLNE
jgi:HEPN domain-containing protein